MTKQGKINTHREEQKSISVYVNNTALVIQMIKNVGFSTKTTDKFTNKSNKNKSKNNIICLFVCEFIKANQNHPDPTRHNETQPNSTKPNQTHLVFEGLSHPVHIQTHKSTYELTN